MSITTIHYDVADLHAKIHVKANGATAIATAIDKAIREATPKPAPPAHIRTIKSRKRAALPITRPDTIVVIPVTRRNARHLVTMLESIRFPGTARGIQLVWDGATDRDLIEPRVFAALEHARSTPKLAPVILARDNSPTLNLLAKTTTTPPCR